MENANFEMKNSEFGWENYEFGLQKPLYNSAWFVFLANYFLDNLIKPFVSFTFDPDIVSATF